MNEPVSPIDDHLRGLLREDPSAPEDARGRVRSRLGFAILTAAIAEQAGSGTPSHTRLAIRPPLNTSRWARTALAFALGTGTGGAVGAGYVASRPPQVVYVERAAPSAPFVEAAPLRPVETTLAEPPAPPAPVTAPPPPAHRVTAATAAPAPAEHLSQLAQERMLLDDARAALVQGESERALDRLEQHHARFAGGQLAEERDAMEVEALVRAGRYDQARERAAAFRATAPDSLFWPTVASAVASIR